MCCLFQRAANIEYCKKVFSWEQWVFIFKHYFLTKSCNEVREQYEKQFSGVNLPSNNAIGRVIRKFKNESSINSLLHSGWQLSKCREERGRKHARTLPHNSSRQLAPCVALLHTSTNWEMCLFGCLYKISVLQKLKPPGSDRQLSLLPMAFTLQSLYSKGIRPSILFKI